MAKQSDWRKVQHRELSSWHVFIVECSFKLLISHHWLLVLFISLLTWNRAASPSKLPIGLCNCLTKGGVVFCKSWCHTKRREELFAHHSFGVILPLVWQWQRSCWVLVGHGAYNRIWSHGLCNIHTIHNRNTQFILVPSLYTFINIQGFLAKKSENSIKQKLVPLTFTHTQVS